MKNFIYSLFIVGVCFSCKSNSTTQSNDSTAVVNVADDDSKELIEKFKPIIQGVWVKKDYIEKVNQTKSPLAAANLTNGITTMYINTDKIVGDSLTFTVGYGNHEGGELTFKFKGKKMKSDHYEINYAVNGKDTVLSLNYTENGKNIRTEYIKALNKQPDDNLGFGMDLLINKGLAVGSYHLTDGPMQQDIIFEADGKVKGFFNFNSYYIDIDLNNDPMTNLDEIGFDIMSKHHVRFNFKINKDTLNLYETRPNADSTELIVGNLKYQLVRKK